MNIIKPILRKVVQPLVVPVTGLPMAEDNEISWSSYWTQLLNTWHKDKSGTNFPDAIAARDATIYPSVVNFNGSDNHGDISKKINMGANDWELEIQFKKTTANTVTEYIFDARDGANDGVRVAWIAAGINKLYASINDGHLIFTGAYSDGNIHTFRMWRSGDTLYGIVDNTEEQNVSVAGKSVATTKNIKLGGTNVAGSLLTGSITYFKYYEFQDTSLKTTWKYPSDFGWSPAEDLGISWDGTKWTYTFDITTKKIGSANDYYIKPDGSDVNDGSTLELAKATMAGVFAQITANGHSDANIIVAAGTYSNAWANNTPTVDCDIICATEAIFIEDTSLYGAKIEDVDNIYIEGITFSGSVGGGLSFYLTHTSTTCKAYFKNCQFNDSSGNGFGSIYGGEIYLVGCTAEDNTKDGFNYHDDASTDVPRVVEIDCIAQNNGTGESDNNSSIHDGGKIIRLGGTYTNSIRNIHDIDGGTRSILLSCTVNTSRGADTPDNSFNIGCGYTGASGVKMWLFDCDVEGGANTNINVYDGSWLYNNVDTENITNDGEYCYDGRPSIHVVSSCDNAKMLDLSGNGFDATLNGTGNKIGFNADATLNEDYAIIDFDPTDSTDTELDIFDKSNSTIHIDTGSMDYYDSSNVYNWSIPELLTYADYNAYFNEDYQDRLFTKVESDVITEILNCKEKQTGSALTKAKIYCGIT